MTLKAPQINFFFLKESVIISYFIANIGYVDVHQEEELHRRCALAVLVKAASIS